MTRGRAAIATIYLALAASPLTARPAGAAHLMETTAETRTVLYFSVPADKLKQHLPQGWEPTAFGPGPTEGANLTLNISEQLNAVGADGKPAGDARGRGITLSARVKDPVTGEARAMVLFGLTNGADTPGPYGTHRPAWIGLERRESDDGGHVRISETWSADDGHGNQMDLELVFQRGDTTASHIEQQTRSVLHPAFYRIYKVDLVAEPVRSLSLHTDHTTQFEFTATGDIATILDGLRTPVAIVSVPVYRRAIWLPD